MRKNVECGCCQRLRGQRKVIQSYGLMRTEFRFDGKVLEIHSGDVVAQKCECVLDVIRTIHLKMVTKTNFMLRFLPQ